MWPESKDTQWVSRTTLCCYSCRDTLWKATVPKSLYFFFKFTSTSYKSLTRACWRSEKMLRVLICMWNVPSQAHILKLVLYLEKQLWKDLEPSGSTGLPGRNVSPAMNPWWLYWVPSSFPSLRPNVIGTTFATYFYQKTSCSVVAFLSELWTKEKSFSPSIISVWGFCHFIFRGKITSISQDSEAVQSMNMVFKLF